VVSGKQFDWLDYAETPIAYGVGGLTAFWTMERVLAFWV